VHHKAPIKKPCHGSGGLATGLSQSNPGFNPRPAHVGFEEDKVASALVFLHLVSCGQYHSTNDPYSFFYLTPMLYDFSSLHIDGKNRAK
jgi:hypothetical protein